MEVLGPSPLPSPYPRLRCGGRRGQHHGEACVHVAVGRSPEKTLGLLRWALRRFGNPRIVLLHVHQPSPLIPTLLGKIPAAQATEELVLSHRKSEKEQMDKVLLSYLAFCRRAQVQATLLLTENDQIHDGILNLVNHYKVTRLVMGSTPDSCFKLKYGKQSLTASNAPAFCQIWFVWRGRHLWTKEASAATDNNTLVHYQDGVMTATRIRFSSYSNNTETILDDEGCVMGNALMAVDLNQGIVSDYDDYEALGEHEANHFYGMSMAKWQDTESALNSTFLSDSSVHMDTLPLYSKEVLDRNLKQVMIEADGSRKEAFVELRKHKETESKVASAIARAKDFDSAKKHEIKMREELEVLLVATRKQHEDLIKNKERAVAGLESSMRRLAILDASAAKTNLQMDEFSAELEVIQSSIESLRHIEVTGRLAELGLRCSETSSQDRLELTPGTVRDLEQIYFMRERQAPSSFLCPILQEIMHDPQVCADGITYEGRAIREWLETGRRTSPVTSLKLEHCNLTPNHALRFAIQDWLRHSHSQ